ncbi:MAG: hypothetical protein ACO1RX_12590 [Candidatus Sericytochromatia bacterium]
MRFLKYALACSLLLACQNRPLVGSATDSTLLPEPYDQAPASPVLDSFAIPLISQAQLSPDQTRLVYQVSSLKRVLFADTSEGVSAQPEPVHHVLNLNNQKKSAAPTGFSLLNLNLWHGNDHLLFQHSGSSENTYQVKSFDVNTQAMTTLFELSEYQRFNQKFGDHLYFKNKNKIERYHLDTGTRETVYQVPLDFYVSYHFQLDDTQEHVVLAMNKNFDQHNTAPPSAFKVQSTPPPQSVDLYQIGPDRTTHLLDKLSNQVAVYPISEFSRDHSFAPGQSKLFARSGVATVEIVDLEQQKVLHTHPGRWLGWFSDQHFVVEDQRVIVVYRLGQEQAVARLSLPDPLESPQVNLLPAAAQILISTAHTIQIHDLTQPQSIQQKTLIDLPAEQGFLKVFPQRQGDGVLWAQNPLQKAQPARLFRYLPASKSSEPVLTENITEPDFNFQPGSGQWYYGTRDFLTHYLDPQVNTP